MLQFLAFKSKGFIVLNSFYSEQIKARRYIARIQTIVSKDDPDYRGYMNRYFLHGKLHREDKENGYTLPSIILEDGSCSWFKNGKCHREDRLQSLEGSFWEDHDGVQIGRVLPAIIDGSIFNGQEWWNNGIRYRNDKDENGKLLPLRIRGMGIGLKECDLGNWRYPNSGYADREIDKSTGNYVIQIEKK